jgi:SAM-dependent methyltransferase
MDTPFSRMLQDDAASDRYYAFRSRDEVAYEAFFEEMLEELLRPTQDEISVLILGPGTGNADAIPFSKAVKNRGIESKFIVTLVDAQPIPKKLLNHFEGIRLIHEQEEADIAKWFRQSKPGKYDLIIAMQVIQHFPDWRSLLCHFTECLRPNGFLIFDRVDGPMLQAAQGQDDSMTATRFRNNPRAAAAIRYYRQREYSQGIFWDPDFAGNKPLRLISVLEAMGFEWAIKSKEFSCQRTISRDDIKNAFRNREFGPFVWGEPVGDTSLEETELIELLLSEIEKTDGPYSEIGKCQLYCYKKKSETTGGTLSNFEVAVNQVRGSLLALGKLDKHLRHDLAFYGVSEQENKETTRRYIQTLVQCLLFSGAINDSIAFMMPIFGVVNDWENWIVEYSLHQHILIRQDLIGKSSNENFESHLGMVADRILSTLMLNEMPFSKFLMDVFQTPVHFRLIQDTQLKEDEVTVKVDCDHICGVMVTVIMPSFHEHHHSKTKVDVVPRRRFQQYYFGEFEYKKNELGEFTTPGLLGILQNALKQELAHLIDAVEDVGKNKLDKLGVYLFSYAHLLCHYDLTIYGFYQVYPVTGVGMLVLGEDRHSAKKYSGLIDAQRELCYFMSREMASAMFFQSIGESTRQKRIVEEKKIELEKYGQMLHLLQGPLNQVVKNIGNVNSSIQELNAILNDPVRAIFAAHRDIADLFDDGSAVRNPDGTQLQIQHAIRDYDALPENERLPTFRWLLAHLLARIRGKTCESGTDYAALTCEIDWYQSALSGGDKHPFYQLATQLQNLLGIGSFDKLLTVELSILTKILENAKSYLFNIFKPSDARNPIHIAVIKALLPKIVVTPGGGLLLHMGRIHLRLSLTC